MKLRISEHPATLVYKSIQTLNTIVLVHACSPYEGIVGYTANMKNTANIKTAIKKVRVECTDLSIGMYVCDLDRPWLDSPFLIQGFYIKDNLDIDTVRGMCEYVYVDKVVARDQLTSNLPKASSFSTTVNRTALPLIKVPLRMTCSKSRSRARRYNFF